MKKLILPIFALMLFSCDDDTTDVVEPTSTIEAINEYAIINKVFQDVGNNTGDATLVAEEDTSTSKSEASKNEPEITVVPFDLTTFPKTITVDFGEGTLCKDGITRTGIITISSTNWYGVAGSKHTSTFNNYYHNDYKVDGTHVVENLGENTDGNLEFSVKIANGKITTKEGATINYTEDSVRTWISGSGTPLNIWDDEYLLDGTQSGESSKGIEYQLTVEESLHFVLLPRGVKSGVLRLDVGELNDVKLNYSDNTVTILGVSYPIEK